MNRQEFISEKAAARRPIVSFGFMVSALVSLGFLVWGALLAWEAGEAGDMHGLKVSAVVFAVGGILLYGTLFVAITPRRVRVGRCPHCRRKLEGILPSLAIASGNCGRCSLPVFTGEKR